jgi:hypothetical protein
MGNDLLKLSQFRPRYRASACQTRILTLITLRQPWVGYAWARTHTPFPLSHMNSLVRDMCPPHHECGYLCPKSAQTRPSMSSSALPFMLFVSEFCSKPFPRTNHSNRCKSSKFQTRNLPGTFSEPPCTGVLFFIYDRLRCVTLSFKDPGIPKTTGKAGILHNSLAFHTGGP